MFQIKDFTSIVASMINHAKATQNKITDFNVGSVSRTMVEAPAVEIEELYQRMFFGLTEAIPTAIYLSFDFQLQPAVSASGNIRVTITPQQTSTIIPAGTVFRADGVSTTFVSKADVTITTGNSYGDVFVTASTAGVIGNIPPSVSFNATPNIYGFVSSTNIAAFSNGSEQETEDQRKVRFAAYIASLTRGTVSALYYGLSLVNITNQNGVVIESVKASKVIEPYLTDALQPVSLVNCYIHNGSTGASAELIARASEVLHGYYLPDGTAIPGWKAAGVKVNVYAATVTAVNVTAALTLLPGYTLGSVSSACLAAVSEYIQSLDIGKAAIFAEIMSIIMNIDGVYNVTISAPTADVAASNITKLMPGTITFS